MRRSLEGLVGLVENELRQQVESGDLFFGRAAVSLAHPKGRGYRFSAFSNTMRKIHPGGLFL